MKPLRVALLVLPALLCVGCIMPLPEFKRDRHGTAIKRDHTAFIHRGKTSQAEVTASLGQPHTTLPGGAIVAYSWERGGTVVGWFGFLQPLVRTEDKPKRWGGWHALFIAYDSHGVVQRSATLVLSQDRSIHEQMHDWAERTSRR